MPSERVRVGFKYNVMDPAQGTVVSETPMELLSGFVGIELDSVTQAMTPKIGWLVRISNEEAESLERLKYQDTWNGGIDLTVEEVPEILAKLQHIRGLRIRFTSTVRLPEWMDALTIDHLSIEGQLSKTEKEAIRKRFPKVEFNTKK